MHTFFLVLVIFSLGLVWNHLDSILSSTSLFASQTSDLAQSLPQKLIPSLIPTPNNHSAVIEVNGTSYNLSNELFTQIKDLRALVAYGEPAGSVKDKEGNFRVKWLSIFPPHAAKLLNYALKLDK